MYDLDFTIDQIVKIRQPVAAELTILHNEVDIQILTSNRQPITADLTAEQIKQFFNIGFTHHREILSKAKSLEERIFYIERCAAEFCSKETLRYHLKSNLFDKQGKILNNFQTAISDKDLQRKALLSFKDEYLLDYINIIKPEYLGKMNFYLSALDDLVRLPHENPSIGIILCKSQNQKTVEYAFRDMTKPMGVATYKTASELPPEYKNILPDAERLKELL